MKPLPHTNLRPPTMDDLQIAFDLIIACDIDDYGEPDSDIGDIEQDWPSIDLEKDALLIFDAAQTLMGYAALFPNNDDFNFDIYARAGEQKSAVFDHLIRFCEARAREMQAAHDKDPASTASTIISQSNVIAAEQLSAHRYVPEKYHFRMQIDLAEAPKIEAWPEGFSLRNIVTGQDEQMLYDFIQKAFAQPGRRPPTFESWSDFMMRKDHFKPELWFLLFKGEELAGASLCFEYEDYGWVRQLAVSETMRRQGLGSQLLRYCFGVFFEKGLPRTDLVVDSTRPKAQSLYENAGMHMTRRFDEYYKHSSAKK